ncbi:glycosyltransferase family 2 protein [Sphingomonas sp.]|uniref:glycosyltransferase family 2 protein n=1 Tax=Sphingomonas sp. TaxID=28214 RepID=UPI001ECEC8C0|nr:glycosyltransferase family 2 protein [Sphingomonas sp.]MBX3594172.1 glycosyltransferase family 2 protein [Sphingomonas sp.]
MEAPPAISVIMPVYNGATHLAATLDSLWAQRFPDFELILVDDGSTDGTRDLIAAQRDPRIRAIFAERNMGPVAARNRAAGEARGRYIAALDADDLALPDRFARQVALLDADRSVAMVATAAEFLLEGGRLRPSSVPAETSPGFLDWLLRFGNPILWSSVMIRADAARRLDPFMRRERMFAEDFDFHHRIRSHGRIARIDEVLLQYRCHAGGISQRSRTRMATRAAAVLRDVNADVWGAEASFLARQVVRYLMLEEPVGDAATLANVIRAVALLPPPADERGMSLAAAHLGRLYLRLARAGVRSGWLSLADLSRLRSAGMEGPGLPGVQWRAVGLARAIWRERNGIGATVQGVAPTMAAWALP